MWAQSPSPSQGVWAVIRKPTQARGSLDAQGLGQHKSSAICSEEGAPGSEGWGSWEEGRPGLDPVLDL